jgi:hypothetical protein
MQNTSYNTITVFKKLLIVFWCAWWLIALWTDVVGGIAYLNWLHADWAPAKNYPFLVESLKMYHLPNWVPALLFLSIIGWMTIISVIFLSAVFRMFARKPYESITDVAFLVSMGLWLAFFIADQLIMNYELEANHMIQASFQFLSWMFLLHNRAVR